MNQKYLKFALLITTIVSLPYNTIAKVETDTTPLRSISLSTPMVFDKETLKKESAHVVSTPLLQKAETLSKTEKKALKKELENIVYRKDAKTLQFDELRKAANLAMQVGWHDKALLYLQQMVSNTKDSEVIKTLKLEIADILFEKGSLQKAGDAFGEYLALYPGSDQSEYAHYKQLLCTFYQTLKTDQDQASTKQAIQLAQSYLEKGLAYKAYRTEIVQIRQQCHAMLYESELNVFNFYMKKKSYGAASGRLAYLKKQYLEKLPEVEPHIISLECRLAQAQGNKEVYQERLAFLHKKFPDYGKTTRVAQGKKKSYTERF